MLPRGQRHVVIATRHTLPTSLENTIVYLESPLRVVMGHDHDRDPLRPKLPNSESSQTKHPPRLSMYTPRAIFRPDSTPQHLSPRAAHIRCLIARVICLAYMRQKPVAIGRAVTRSQNPTNSKMGSQKR